jgi:excisionase family DNA binding protein
MTKTAMTEPLRPFFTVGELSELLNLPAYLLAQRLQRERCGIPHYRIGKLVRFRLDEVQAWLLESCNREQHGRSRDRDLDA